MQVLCHSSTCLRGFASWSAAAFPAHHPSLASCAWSPGMTQASGHPGSIWGQAEVRQGWTRALHSRQPLRTTWTRTLTLSSPLPGKEQSRPFCLSWTLPGPRGLWCTSSPPHPGQHPHESEASPLGFGARSQGGLLRGLAPALAALRYLHWGMA